MRYLKNSVSSNSQKKSVNSLNNEDTARRSFNNSSYLELLKESEATEGTSIAKITKKKKKRPNSTNETLTKQ
jgi:hypothetical protein